MGRTVEELSNTKRSFPRQGDWTEEDYFNLPETNHFVELSEGRLVIPEMPSDLHQNTLRKLFRRMDNFVEENALGEIRFAPLPVRLWHNKVREPDIIFVNNTHRDRIGKDFWSAPDLAVEIISPGTEHTDRKEKIIEYAQAGISEYWIVDAERKTIEVFILEQRAYRLMGKWGAGEVVHSEILAGFEVKVDAILG